jgi:hypothetical protein
MNKQIQNPTNSLATLWQLLVFAIAIPYSPVLLPCFAPPEKEDETSATWNMSCVTLQHQGMLPKKS